MTAPNCLYVEHQPRPWRCTRGDATYCPLCGNCSCPLEQKSCPLHGDDSAHGCCDPVVVP